MRIQITLTPHDELADDADGTGLTEEAFLELNTRLSAIGYDFEFKKVED